MRNPGFILGSGVTKLSHIIGLWAITLNCLFVSFAVAEEDVCTTMQSADPDFKPYVVDPAYPNHKGERPVVAIDEAHYNFHTMKGRYRAFANLLKNDGYHVVGSQKTFTQTNLQGIDILVIANALNEINYDRVACELNAKLPTPSAFTDQEIQAVMNWVEGGGSLLLIADHMPFAGAAEKLADAFGITVINGYTFPADYHYMIKFKSVDGSLSNHPITEGRIGKNEAVTSVTSFVGQAFFLQPSSKAQPIMVLGDGTRTILPVNVKALPAKPSAPTDLAIPNISSVGMLQGATLALGKGRVVIMGEGGMLSAQKSGKIRMGMNNPEAQQNKQFVLNTLHWLSRIF